MRGTRISASKNWVGNGHIFKLLLPYQARLSLHEEDEWVEDQHCGMEVEGRKFPYLTLRDLQLTGKLTEEEYKEAKLIRR